VILGIGGKVGRQVIDAVSQAHNLHVRAASVSVMQAESLGILEGDLAHLALVFGQPTWRALSFAFEFGGRSKPQPTALARETS
jgi:hypothetical protein